MSKENVINAAVSFMFDIAKDSAHGYDQGDRWGPDYDCSSLVISAYDSAGTGVKSAGATYTGNMKAAFLQCGFSDVTGSVALYSGSGLQYGDVLLNETHHTAMFIGGGKLAQASINERGGITGGQTGDQTGGEISVRSYYNFPWDCVLRLSSDNSDSAETTEIDSTYTIQSGDTLSGIAAAHGTTLAALISANDIVNPDLIYPGQILSIPWQPPTTPQEEALGAETTCTVDLQILAQGAAGAVVEALQTLLELRGYGVGPDGADGDFGDETESAVKKFQQDHGLEVDGVVGVNTWTALLS